MTSPQNHALTSLSVAQMDGGWLSVDARWNCAEYGPQTAKGAYEPPTPVVPGDRLTNGQAAELAAHFMEECPCQPSILTRRAVVERARVVLAGEAA